MKRIAKFVPLFLALLITFSALPLNAGSSPTATDLLLTKARSLQGRGRLDLASQAWQQVLMADPNQPEALAGLAQWARQSGRTEEADRYLARLRQVAPNDPAIARIEQTKVIGTAQRSRLEEAGRLAQKHDYAGAMQIFREVLGPVPPPGEWAIAFYETEAAIPDTYAEAVSGLRRLSQRFPNDAAYSLSLGRLLTYRPETRIEGCRLLAAISPDSKQGEAARMAWRQALVWDGSSRSSLPLLREHLKRYPDPELQASLEKLEHDKPEPAVPQHRARNRLLTKT